MHAILLCTNLVRHHALQFCLRILSQVHKLVLLHWYFLDQDNRLTQLHHCDNTFRLNLFCPREPVSPDTSLVTFDKIPPTKPSPSRDQGACLSTTGILSIQQNRNFQSESSSNFTVLYSSLILLRHKERNTQRIHADTYFSYQSLSFIHCTRDLQHHFCLQRHSLHYYCCKISNVQLFCKLRFAFALYNRYSCIHKTSLFIW